MNKENASAWQALYAHQQKMMAKTLRQQFADDPNRFAHYHIEAADLLFDFSKQPIDDETLSRLIDLANASNFIQQRDALFAGERMNVSEQRQALHMAWRQPHDAIFPTAQTNVMPTVKQLYQHSLNLSNAIRKGDIGSITHRRFTDIIHIGIGGSSLGMALLNDVFYHTDERHLRLHFVETLDSSQLYDTLAQCDPETSAIVIASKSFSTVETMHNAKLAIHWLVDKLPNYPRDLIIKMHCFAITHNETKARAWGIDQSCIFALPDWVGGRYSIWSTMSFSIMAAFGETVFQELLAGAYAMDNHFLTTPLSKNMPVVHGLLRIWLNNVLKKPTYAILPYAYDLRKLPSYLQQLDMESNGKSMTSDGLPVQQTTAPLLWGGAQTQAQHSIHQWLHQGINDCPVDFMCLCQLYAESTCTSRRTLIIVTVPESKRYLNARQNTT